MLNYQCYIVEAFLLVFFGLLIVIVGMSRSRSYRIHKANPGAFEGFSLLQLGMTQLNLVGGTPTPLKNDGVRQLG